MNSGNASNTETGKPQRKISAKKKGSRSDIIDASETGDVEKLKNILLTEVDIEANEEAQGVNLGALLTACTYGHKDILETLLQSGADVNVRSTSTYRTGLHEVCIGGHVDCLRLLADKVETLNAQDKDGLTAAHLAAFNGEAACLKFLAEKGASLVQEDGKGRQPAHLAAIRNHKKILQILFDNRVDLDCRCDLGKTPVHYASQHGALEGLVLLVERDCDITLGDNNGYLAAHLAARHDKLNCLRFLVNQGTALGATQADGKTPAHVAAYHGSYNVLHWLFEKGAEPNSQDYFGNSPGHYATQRGKAECFNCYLQHDGELEIQNINGDTPLDSAKKAGHPLLMEKAVKNETPCPLCFHQFKKKTWDILHPPADVERNIVSVKSTAYNNPVPPLKKPPSQVQMNIKKREPKQNKIPKQKLPDRDIAAKYFGNHLDPNSVFKFKP